MKYYSVDITTSGHITISGPVIDYVSRSRKNATPQLVATVSDHYCSFGLYKFGGIVHAYVGAYQWPADIRAIRARAYELLSSVPEEVRKPSTHLRVTSLSAELVCSIRRAIELLGEEAPHVREHLSATIRDASGDGAGPPPADGSQHGPDVAATTEGPGNGSGHR